MSYILDAIKKADQKRKLGEVPGLSTTHEAPIVEPRRFGWLYGVAAILFINAGGLAWWLWVKAPGQEPVVPVPSTPVAVTAQQMPGLSTFQKVDLQKAPVASVATAPPAPPSPVATSPPVQPRAESSLNHSPVEAAQGRTSDARISKQSSQAVALKSTPPPANRSAYVPVQKESPPPASSAVEQVPEENAASDNESLAGNDEFMPVEERTDSQMESDQVLAPIATSLGSKERAKKAKREEEDPELAKIPFLKQLPVEIQQSLPALHISFHSYSLEPSARLVSISGKILRQGQEFDENLKLERITVKGVVLNFKGKRFRIEV